MKFFRPVLETLEEGTLCSLIVIGLGVLLYITANTLIMFLQVTFGS
jgi:hypothetical protein